MTHGRVLSVNVAEVPARTGIDKRPVDRPVQVRAPGPKHTGLHSGLVGDHIKATKLHGGDDQAVYAYAREDLDWWAGRLGRDLPGGMFGENLTTVDVDVNGALIGEIWQVGDTLRLQTSYWRTPCMTFQRQMGEPQWVKRFAAENRPGAYLRVLTPGEVRAGDRIEIVSGPAESLTIAEAFRIYTHEPASLARLLTAEALPADTLDRIRVRVGASDAARPA
ncbi:MOSC domain-containing protein [Micromonosporaceae bacterium Da 78-11]